MTMLNRFGPRLRTGTIGRWFLIIGLILPMFAMPASAQCPNSLSTNLTCNNGTNGIAFELKALRSISPCKIRYGGTATGTVEIWAHPNGLPFSKAQGTNINDNLWFYVGSANVSLLGDDPAHYVEIPVDLSVLGVLSAGQKLGFVVFMPGRYMTGVAPYTFSNGDIELDTEFWAVGGTTGPGNQTAFTTPNAPRQFCGSVSYSLVTSPNDAGIASIDSPLNFCPGTYPIIVSLRNYGTNQLTSATINWSLNGVVQTPYVWSGFLDTLDFNARTTSITLGSYNFLANVPYTISAWTTNPNGAADTVNMNDTITVTRKTAFSGVYTIGGSSPDYPTFAAAISDLEANGLCGPVLYKVRTGTYTEHVHIGDVTGTSSTNTITFEAETGVSNEVTLRSTATGTTDNFAVSLDGCRYVTFRKMTLTATNATYSTVVLVQGGAEYCTLDGLNLVGLQNTTSTSTNNAVVYSPSGSIDSYNTIRNCNIQYGMAGIYWYGSSTTALEPGTVIENNTITGFGYYGIYLYYQDGSIVRNNVVSTSAHYTTVYGLSLGYADNAIRVTGNKVTVNNTATVYGMRIYYCDATPGQEGIIANNFVAVNNGTGNTYSLYDYYSTYQKYYNNTIYTSSTYATAYHVYTAGGSDREFVNNIFYNAGAGYAWYCGTNPAPITRSDYNVIYAAGTNIAYWAGAARASFNDLLTVSGMDANSVSKTVTFTDASNGDLHLAGASLADIDLIGTIVTDVLDDVDGESRILPNRGGDEARSSVATLDAGISSIDSPLNFCAGINPVTVTMRNYGLEPLTSVTINWSINAVLQTPVAWTGILDTLNVMTRGMQVTLGSYNFLSGVPYTVSVWTTAPNSGTDGGAYNDMITVNRKSAISGVMTVGGPGANYPTFAAAIADLESNGLCGPATFKVRSDTYTEQISIGSIPGASSVNTLTFESETGNRSDVRVEYSAPDLAGNFVLRYIDCQYVTFRNMTLTALNATYSTVVLVTGGAENNTLENLDLNGVPTTSSTSTNNAVVYSPSGTVDPYHTIRGCNIRYGMAGIYWYGSSATALVPGLIVEDNTITDFWYMGFYSYYLDAPQVNRNTIKTDNHYTTCYGLSVAYGDNLLRILGNTVTINGVGTIYGMRVYYCDAALGQEGLVANNFVTVNSGTGNTYTLYDYYSTYQKFYFNTFYTTSTYATAYHVYTYYGSSREYLNNIMYNEGPGYAWYTNPAAAPITVSDYNVIFTNGASLAYWNGAAQADLSALQTTSGLDANSISKIVNFKDAPNGDLHLAGSSIDDVDLYGEFVPEVTYDIDNDSRAVPYRGADEACYITRGTVSFNFSNSSGDPIAYANIPGSVGVRCLITFPEYDANISVTLRFYAIPGGIFTGSKSFSVQKLYGQPYNDFTMVSLDGLPAGTYRVEATMHTKNSCGSYQDYIPGNAAFMIYPTGTKPCVVWPGDVNNDGLVNYGDRKSLNQYIHNANLSALWLQGPMRYRADLTWDPLTAIRWEPQAATPWSTAEGCYMDADGNGFVNSFDYIPIMMNWMRSHGDASPKPSDQFSVETFDMSQNFPNPFNPSTNINLNVPERSKVKLTIFDQNGREIATLIDGNIEPGLRTLTFDASNLTSGIYLAFVSMQGTESGLTFTKTIRMTFAK